MLKYLYIFFGFITLSLGLLGIITPGLPTTPFLLLTAFLFTKGSPKLHKKLMENRLIGGYIKRVNGGLGPKAILFSIAFMWVMICITAFAVFDYGTMRFVMIGLGIVGTISQIIVLGKRKRKKVSVPVDIDKNNCEKL